MTMTAPLELPALDLRAAILAGTIPVHATVHLSRTATLGRSIRRELDRAALTAYAAIEKNLEPAGLERHDGTTRLEISPEPHGDGWLLFAAWRAS